MEETNMVRLVVHVTPEQKAALERLSAKTAAPVAALVRRFIEAGLKKGKA